MAAMEKTFDEVVNGKKRDKPISWAELQREVIRQKLTGEMKIPKPTPTPTPSPIDTKGYYVSEETGRHVLTDPALIRQSQIDFGKQGYMTLGGERVRGLDIEWEPHGVPSKFPWLQRRGALGDRRERKGPGRTTVTEDGRTVITEGGRTYTYAEGKLAHVTISGKEKGWMSYQPERFTWEVLGPIRQVVGTHLFDFWKKGLLKQYPESKYRIEFKGGEALIYERHQIGVPSLQALARKFVGLEREAQDAFRSIQQQRAKGEWIPPLFGGVSKRRGSLAEFDIPYNVEELVAQLFPWKKEHLTPKEFEKKYGPFASSLGLVEGARITHVRRTGKGFELKYLPPFAYDPIKPWGVTKEDVKTLMSRGLMTTASFAEKYMKGEWITGKQYTPEQFSKKIGLKLDIPKESIITAYKHSVEGYEFRFLPKEDWLSLPAYVKEGREPTFGEVPFYTHLVKGWSGLLAKTEEVRKQIYGEKYVAFQKLTPTGRMREAERQLSYQPIGMVKRVESAIGFAELLITGKPTHRTYIPTAGGAVTGTILSFFPETKIGPWTIGEGGWGATGKYWEAEMESVKEAPIGLIAGELTFDLLLAYVTGKVGGKAWGKLPKRVTTPFEKAYAKVTSPITTRLTTAKLWVQRQTPASIQKQLWPKIYLEQHVLSWKTGKYTAQEVFGFTEMFRPEYKWVGFPTKYETYMKYLEWLGKRRTIETSLAWGKTAYPGYGVSVEKGAKPLTLEQTLAQAERVPTYRTEITPRLGLVKGKPEYTFTSWSVQTGKETMFTQRAALEFQQSLQRAMPTRYYIPTTKGMAIQPFKGTPTTPFEQSLAKAFGTPEKIVRGGRQFLVSELAVKPATYTIAERVMRELGIAKTKTATTSFMKLRQTVIGPIAITKPIFETVKKAVSPTIILHPFLWRGGEYPSKFAMEKMLLSQRLEAYPTTKTIFKAFPKLKQKEKEALKLAGFARFATITIQRQKQKQKQKQIQKLMQSQALQLKHIQSLVQRPSQIQIVKQKQAQIQVLRQEQALKLRQLQLSVTAQSAFLAYPPYETGIVPTPTRPPPTLIPPVIIPPFAPLKLPGLQRRTKRGRRRGAWYFRTHAIARARTVAGLVTGKPRRKNGLGDFGRINQAMHGSRKRRKPRKRRNQLADLAKKLKRVI